MASLVVNHHDSQTAYRRRFLRCRIECPERFDCAHRRRESNGLFTLSTVEGVYPERFIPSLSRKVEGLYYVHMYFVYMMKNSYDDLYIGITEDPQQRLNYHNENRGALFTKRDSKFQIVFLEKHPALADARRREIQIKKWRRDKKEYLIERYKAGLPTKLNHY